MRKEGYRTTCGGVILLRASAEEYYATHPEATTLLEEAAQQVVLPTDGRRLEVQVDLGRPLGLAGLVETPAIGLDTPTTFAQRLNREGPSRMVEVAEAELPQVSTFVIVAESTEAAGIYKLVTAYVGVVAPGEPWDTTIHKGDDRSLPFWMSHALVWKPTMGSIFTSTWRVELEKVRAKRRSP